MRITIVPAQITTVEDRIVGNLTFVQILLLIFAMISGSAIYLTLPPHLSLSVFKSMLIIFAFAVFSLLAIRVKGKIIADWLVLLLSYRARPRVYVFTKNDPSHRDFTHNIKVKKNELVISDKKKLTTTQISLTQKVKMERLIANPTMSLSFSKKGNIDVSLTPYKK